MMDALAGCKGLAPQLLVEAMRDAVGQFVADAPQSDDLTMLCISNQSL